MSGLPAPSADAVPSGTGSTIGAYQPMIGATVADRCVEIDGALVRVSEAFDASEGSEDLKAMRAVLGAAREKLAQEPTIEAHEFEAGADRPRRCVECGRGRFAPHHDPAGVAS